jgi:hypothetical protein
MRWPGLTGTEAPGGLLKEEIAAGPPSGQSPKRLLDDYPKLTAARQNSELVATVALENGSSVLWKFANSFTVSFTVTK